MACSSWPSPSTIVSTCLRGTRGVKLQPTRRGPLQLMPITTSSRAASGSTRSHQVSKVMDSTRSPCPQIFAALWARGEVDQKGSPTERSRRLMKILGSGPAGRAAGPDCFLW